MRTLRRTGPAVALALDRDDPCPHLQAHGVGGGGHVGHELSRAERRVPGEGQLARRREDTDASRRRLGRQNKRRLRQVELQGDGLHLVVGEASAIFDHGKRVAAPGVLSEDVDPAKTLTRRTRSEGTA